MSDVVRTELGMVMDIGGTTYEVVQFGADWGINTIPMAEAVIAIGRRASDGVTPASIHKSLGKLGPESRVKVYFCPTGQWSAKEAWPEGPHLIFDGNVINTGYTKVNGKVQFVVRLIHWLAKLNYTSAVSAQSHPSNPSEYTFQSIMGARMKTGVAKRPSGIAGTSEAKSITMANVREDLWAKAIKPFFCNIAKGERVRLNGDLKSCGGIEDNDNSQALAALSKIEGETEDSCTLERSCYTPPMSMISASEDVPITVAGAIAKAISFDTIESFVHSTLWGKLVGYSTTFGGAVIPLVETALVVPFVPGIRKTYCKKVSSCDYSYINFGQQISQLLQGIALIGTKEFNAGTPPGASRGVTSLAGMGGCYAPADAGKGMIKFVRAPAWLDNIAYSGHSAKKPIGLDGKSAFSSATTPVSTNAQNLIANEDGKKRDEIIKATATMYDDYAHYIYVLEALRGRAGTLSGKLRFDISPGSNILIEGSAERFLAEGDSLAQNLIANVQRVSIGINAESGQAGTTLAVNYIRTEKENSDDKYSVGNHPLYAESFLGAPLVKKLWFSKEGLGCCDQQEKK